MSADAAGAIALIWRPEGRLRIAMRIVTLSC